MQEVILINEDNHGLLAVALDYFSAVKYLIENGWLDDTIEIGIDDDLKELSFLWGDEWVDKILELDDVDKFNETFEGVFHLSVERVFGSAE